MEKDKRISILDGARGLCILLMILHHVGFDMYLFGFLPESFIFGAWLTRGLSPLFASVFILISGIASQYSRSNVRRGVKTLGAAVLVTLATWAVGEIVVFGILHFYGVAMILYGLCRKWIDKVPKKLAPVLWGGLFVVCYIFLLHRNYDIPGLWWLGIHDGAFFSADYYPLLPWIFMFFLGAWAGTYVKDRKLPDWFYDAKVPFFPAVGRHGLIIYLLHQPVGYGLCYLAYRLINR